MRVALVFSTSASFVDKDLGPKRGPQSSGCCLRQYRAGVWKEAVLSFGVKG